MNSRFDLDPDIKAAAELARLIHERDARTDFQKRGLSDQATAELIDKNFLPASAVFDGKFTEALMQRELTTGTFNEVRTLRRS